MAKPPPKIVMAPPPVTGPVSGLTEATDGQPSAALQGEGQVLVDRRARARSPGRSRRAAGKSPPLVSVKSLLPDVMSVKFVAQWQAGA